MNFICASCAILNMAELIVIHRYGIKQPRTVHSRCCDECCFSIQANRVILPIYWSSMVKYSIYSLFEFQFNFDRCVTLFLQKNCLAECMISLLKIRNMFENKNGFFRQYRMRIFRELFCYLESLVSTIILLLFAHMIHIQLSYKINV